MFTRLPLAKWRLGSIATLILLTTVATSNAALLSNEVFAEQMNAFIEKAVAQDLGPGVAVAVVRGDEILYLGGHGFADREAQRPATEDTVFYIASSTKSFTALAAALLAGRGELDLEATLSEYLPGVELHPNLSADQITLQNLLTHTHGIDNSGPITFRCAYSGQHTPELLLKLLRHHGPQEDGPKFEYGNVGYNIATMAMDAKLGVGWKDLLKREVFDPLGMESTTGYVSTVAKDRLAHPYRPEPDGFRRGHYAKVDENMHSAGGLVTTARDVARWLEVNINDGRLDGSQVLPKDAFDLVHSKHAEQDSSFGVFQRDGYGLGWVTGSYDGDLFVSHFGGFSGFHSHIGFMPEHKIGVAVFVNTGAGSQLAGSIAQFAYDVLLDKGPPESISSRLLANNETAKRQFVAALGRDRARRTARPQDLPRALEDYTGIFESPALGRAEIKLVDGKLEATMGPLWSAIEVFDAKQNALRVELTGGGSVVTYQFDGETGPATSIETGGDVFARVVDE